MIRLLVVISLCVWGFLAGGWTGFMFCFLIFGIIGAIFPKRQRRKEIAMDTEQMWEKVETARRGSEIDPTRPDDHPLLLTHEVKRRR